MALFHNAFAWKDVFRRKLIKQNKPKRGSSNHLNYRVFQANFIISNVKVKLHIFIALNLTIFFNS